MEAAREDDRGQFHLQGGGRGSEEKHGDGGVDQEQDEIKTDL